MIDAYFAPSGASATVDALVIPHAQKLANYLVRQVNPYARFVETRVGEAGAERVETIVFDVDVELSQITAFDIHPTERISVSCMASNDAWPEVLALRKDFPIVPHLNLRPVEFPRSLCLYAEAYSEGRLRWTAISIVERVRTWLSETAAGVLHKDDQPLEPLFLGTRDTIVLPREQHGGRYSFSSRALIESLGARSIPRDMLLALFRGKEPRSLLHPTSVHRSCMVS